LVNYQFGGNDHIEQLPIIYRTNNPAFLTNDFFTNSSSGFSPRFYYAQLISILSRFIGVPWLFFLGTILSNCATSILTFLIGKRLFTDATTGIIASALVMFSPTIALGGDQVFYASLFTPTTLVFPLILLSFYLLLQKKIMLSVIITGIVSLFHVLIGLEYGILFLSIFMIHEYLEQGDLKKIIQRSSLFLILVLFLLPNLIPHYYNKTSIESSLFIEILAHFRHPHHYVLSKIMTLKEIGRFVLIILMIIFVLVNWKNRIRTVYYQRTFQITAVLLGIALLTGWIFVELIPSKFITSLQLLRILNFGKWLFLLLVANHLALNIKNRKFNLRAVLVLVLLGSLWFTSEISWQKILMMGIFSSFLIFLLTKEFKVSLYATIISVIGIIIVTNGLDYPPIKKYQKKYLASNELTKNQQNLTEFIRTNTSQESVFLSPHSFGFMRIEARRALVVDFKAFPFKETAMLDWYHRIQACYGPKEEAFESVYKSLNDQKIRELQKKYAFNYVILYQETETKIPVVYTDSEYKIIDLTSYGQ
jgi:hypothetical protein